MWETRATERRDVVRVGLRRPLRSTYRSRTKRWGGHDSAHVVRRRGQGDKGGGVVNVAVRGVGNNSWVGEGVVGVEGAVGQRRRPKLIDAAVTNPRELETVAHTRKAGDAVRVAHRRVRSRLARTRLDIRAVRVCRAATRVAVGTVQHEGCERVPRVEMDRGGGSWLVTRTLRERSTAWTVSYLCGGGGVGVDCQRGICHGYVSATDDRLNSRSVCARAVQRGKYGVERDGGGGKEPYSPVCWVGVMEAWLRVYAEVVRSVGDQESGSRNGAEVGRYVVVGWLYKMLFKP